jgi:hypothetical protein
VAFAELEPDGRAVLVGPGRLDQLAAQVGVAGLGGVPPPRRRPAGVLAWHQATEPGERGRPTEPAPVTDLAGQGQRASRGTPGRRSSGARRRRTGRVVPAGQVGLDGSQLGVTNLEHGPVVRMGGGQRGLVEALGQQPAPWVSVQAFPPRQGRPWRSRNVDSRCRARVRSSTMSARARHRSRTASSRGVGMRMATSSPARCSRASRRQSRRSVSGLVAGGFGISEGAITSQRTPMLSSSQASSNRSGRPPSRLAAAGDCRGGRRACAPTPRHEESGRPRGRPSRGKQHHRDGVFVDVQAKVGHGEMRDTGHARSFRLWLRPRSIVMTQVPATRGTEPAAPC